MAEAVENYEQGGVTKHRTLRQTLPSYRGTAFLTIF